MDASQINEVVDNLAEKLGVAVEQVAPIAEEAVQQVAMRGLVQAGLGVALLAAAILFGYGGKKCWVRLDTCDGCHAEPYIVGCVVSWVAGCATAIAATINIYDGLIAYVAPLAVILKL